MKPALKLLLACSLAGNLALLGYVATRRNPPAATLASAANPAQKPAATTSGAQTGTDMWKILITGEQPAGWIQNLRAAGFPESIIKAVISAQIHERFSGRREELQKQEDEPQYWSKSWNSWGGDNPKTRTALRALWREEREEIKKALGDAYADHPEYQRMLQRQYGSLPKEKISALQTLAEDYQELASDIYSNNVMLPEDREKLIFLEKEKHADLAEILTPQELQDYELRSSQTANNLRWQLSAFSPSEQEFRSIFALRRDFELQFPDRRSNNDEAAQKARSDAQAAMDAQIKSALGEARYADYQRAQDGNYQQLANLTERLALPKETAVAVYDLSKDVQKRAQQIRNDKNLNNDSRNQALTALADEATAKITASLGDRGLEAYKENGGWWLNNLAPRPAKK